MTKQIGMLRGINVGSQNQIRMPVLKELFAQLGATDIMTYVQSGNVVFTPPAPDTGDFAARIENQIERVLGLAVRCVLRNTAEMESIVTRNPFLARGEEWRTLHVTFLAAEPDPVRIETLTVPAHAPDEFIIDRREIFLNCPNGYGQTKLTNSLWERKLATVATTRNWNTVTKLLELASVPSGD